MAQIRKMLIQGVRSFDPDGDTAQIIEFFSPMTLIVGQNGCGKTTIIEALKFSITGETPPNTSKGGSFVNDPKLGNGYEVKAHVKLELLDRMGDKITVSRKLKSSVKGKLGNVSMQTVEGTITRQSAIDKKKTTLQAKCLDMKDEMCRIVGVSEAILNNVIFCHQEDSCWPLDEASKVKQKFDAIFNTTMYIKALKSLQDHEKTVHTKVKLLTGDLSHAADNLKMANRKKAQLEDQKTNLKSLTDLIATADGDTAELDRKYRTLEKLQKEYTDIKTKVTSKRTEIKGLNDNIRELREKIKEPFKGGLTDLENAIANFDYLQQQKNTVLAKSQREVIAKDNESKALHKAMETCLQEKGVFQGAERAHLKRIEDMKAILKKFASFCKNLKENSQGDFPVGLDTVLMSFELDMESVEADTAIKAISSAVQIKMAEAEKLKEEFNAKEKDIQDKLNELRSLLATQSAELNLKSNSERENSKKIAEFARGLRELEGSTEKLQELDDEEAKWNSAVENIEKTGVIAKFENDIKSLRTELVELEKERKVATEQQSLLSRDFAVVEQINSMNTNKSRKNQGCKDIMRRIEPQLKNVMESVPEENLAAAIRTELASLKSKIAKIDDKKRKVENEVVKTEMNIKQVNQQLTQKEQELRTWKQKVNRVLEGESFEEELANALEQVMNLEQELSLADAVKVLYGSYIKQLNKRPCCPLCKRDFERHTEKEKMIIDLTSKVEAQNKDAQADELRKLKTKAESLTELKPNWTEKSELETIEIPKLKEQKAGFEERLKTLRSSLEDLVDELNVLQADEAIVQNASHDAALYDANRMEIKKIDDEIRKLERTRNADAAELTVTLDDVQSKLEDLSCTIAAKTLEKESKESSRNTKINALNQAKEKLNTVRSKRNDITSQLQNREGVESQKKALEEENVILKAAIQDLTRKLPTAKRDITEAEGVKTELIKNRDQGVKQLNQEISQLDKEKIELNSLYKEIDGFATVKAKHAKDEENFGKCSAKLKECEAKLVELRKEVDIIKTEIQSQETKKRDLEDSLSIMHKEAEVVKLLAEIGDQEKAIDESKTEGVRKQMEDVMEKLDRLSSTKHQNKGQIARIRENIRELMEELSERPLVDAEAVHQKKFVEKMVHEKAHKDIRIYRTALDHAVMTFHHKRMEAINKHLKFYWQRVYKGNDIDYIMIKTDNEDLSSSKSTVKLDMSKTQRKVYNYRVVMCKRGIELDMRGRCSAGQKVLASIIIRIALSQTFGAQCGIITLDEPTTNLDKPNIESLGEMLSDLARSMRDNKTFQLVVITHDQDFIDRLLRVDPADYFYRVSRNQLGFSKIERIAK